MTAAGPISSTTSSDDWTFTHSRLHCSPPPYLTTCGITIGWCGSGTPTVRMCFGRATTSLAACIELSLASQTLCELGPDARGFLGVIAFFPQGIDESNLDRLFPTISDRTNIFDEFCVLSLTHRSSESIAMLAPLRDYICPKDLLSSPLSHITKCYVGRLLVTLDPDKPSFGGAQWITSEDVNVEHCSMSLHPLMQTQPRSFRTLGFALAKGFIRGLTRCPNPSS